MRLRTQGLLSLESVLHFHDGGQAAYHGPKDHFDEESVCD